MFFSDKGTRDLVPLIEVHLDEIVGPGPDFEGDPAPVSDVPVQTTPFGVLSAENLPPVEHETDNDAPTSSVGDPTPAHAHTQVIEASGENADASHAILPIPLDQSFFMGNPVSFTYRGATGELEPNESTQPGQDSPVGQGVSDPASSGGLAPSSAPGVPSVPDDTHTIDVTQFAEVHQDASIFVSGYIGEVVARLHIDQDLFMDQDVDIAFTIDGDGHFTVLLDQYTHIDQDISVDVNIYDDDGVLYIEVFLYDSIEVEQDTAIDMQISDGPLGGTVEVNQDIELDQDVDINIDIEDELEQRYLINTSVEVRQAVDVGQDAIVGIAERDGEVELDVAAVQTAAVDQETIVHADFVLI